MSWREIYTATPLATQSREIRLLVLDPGVGEAPLQGDLIIESLNYHDLHYSTLSYTWSGAVRENGIQIKGLPFPTTENLRLALNQFRSPTRKVVLWVDAVCINQSDDQEKNSQVTLMRDIYANATRTWIWVGESADDSDTALEFLRSIQHIKRDRMIVDEFFQSIPFRAVAKLLERRWWTRIWVIQEVLVSRRTLLRCGKQQVAFECFVRLEEVRKAIADLGPLGQRYARLPLQPFANILSEWYLYRRSLEVGGIPILDLMAVTKTFESSLRRDRWFALLGLSTDETRTAIIPDYSNTTSDRLIFVRLMMLLLQTSKTLQPLQYAHTTKVSGWPSWVPDWTAVNYDQITLDNTLQKEYDSTDSDFPRYDPRYDPPIQEISNCQEPRALLVGGVILDRVKYASRMPHVRNDIVSHVEGRETNEYRLQQAEFKAEFEKWLSRLQDLLDEEGSCKDLVEDHVMLFREECRVASGPSARKELLGNLLKAWTIKALTRCGEENDPGPVIEHLKIGMKAGERPMFTRPEDVRELINAYKGRMHSMGVDYSEWIENEILQRCEGKTLYFTDKQWYGITNVALREEDAICSLAGGTRTFILRRQGEYWELVGDTDAISHLSQWSDDSSVSVSYPPLHDLEWEEFKIR